MRNLMSKNKAQKKIHLINSAWKNLDSEIDSNNGRNHSVLYPTDDLILTVAEDSSEADDNYNSGIGFDFLEHPANRDLNIYPFNDDDSRYIFAKCLAGDEVSENPDNAPAVDAGGGLVQIPITGTALVAGGGLIISGSTNYDGEYIIQAKATNSVTIYADFVAETFAGTENLYQGVLVNADISAS